MTKLFLFASSVIFLVLTHADLYAQAPAQTATMAAVEKPKDLPPGFKPVSGKELETEKISATPLVTGAYAMFFVFMFGYVVHVARSQAAMAKEMAELAERIKKAEKK